MKRINLEYKWLVGIVYVLALFLDLLDVTIINVAIPTLAQEFNVTTTTIEWVVTGYLLALAVMIPVSGWLGDRFGTKPIFMLAITLFASGSLLAGLSWNIESLIGFRVLQGVGGGMLTPVGMAMLFRAFPPSERAAASAILVIPITIAPALGPILGGYLVDYQDWRLIFFVNVPIAAVALMASAFFLRNDIVGIAGRLDLPGFLLSGTGLVTLVYGLSLAGHNGFADPEVLGFMLAGLALLAVFTLVELRTREPMVDVRLLGDKLFGASNVVMLLGTSAQMGAFFLLPIFLQTQKGLSPFDVGLSLFPMAIGVALVAQPAAKLYAIIGPRRMMITGFVGIMLLTFHLATIDYTTAGWVIGANMLLRGMFFGFVIIPMNAAAFATISGEDTGRASSIFNVTRQAASSLGVAVLATVLTSRIGAHDAVLGDPASAAAALASFQDTFIIAGFLAILGIVASFWIDDKKARAAAGLPLAEGVPFEASFQLEESAAG